MVSTHLSGARAFESVILVLALGNLITAAPTRFADLAAGPLDVYVPVLDPNIFNDASYKGPNLVARAKSTKGTTSTTSTPGTVPVKSQTGYETNEAFMAASTAYHKLTDEIYTPAAAAATTAWDGLGKYRSGDLSGLRADQIAEASKLATAAAPLFESALDGATKVKEAREAAVAKFGEKLLQEGNMKSKSHQNHIDTAAGWAKNVATWSSRLTLIAKLKRTAN